MTQGNPDDLAVPDTMPTKKVEDQGAESGEDSDAKELIELKMWEFFLPDNKYRLLQKRWGSFTLATVPFYLLSLFFSVYGVDQYTDVGGEALCGVKTTAKDARAVYQTAIGLTVVYHSIEFMRMLALAASALVGANLIIPYYILSLNVLFGVIALVIALITRFGADGSACAAAQPGRATYLLVQIVPLILLLFSGFHVLLYMRVKGVEWCNQVINEESEDEDDD